MKVLYFLAFLIFVTNTNCIKVSSINFPQLNSEYFSYYASFGPKIKNANEEFTGSVLVIPINKTCKQSTKMDGKIVVFTQVSDFSTSTTNCNNIRKVYNAQLSGAIGRCDILLQLTHQAVILMVDEQEAFMVDGVNHKIRIPVLSVGLNDSKLLFSNETISSNLTITFTLTPKNQESVINAFVNAYWFVRIFSSICFLIALIWGCCIIFVDVWYRGLFYEKTFGRKIILGELCIASFLRAFYFITDPFEYQLILPPQNGIYDIGSSLFITIFLLLLLFWLDALQYSTSKVRYFLRRKLRNAYFIFNIALIILQVIIVCFPNQPGFGLGFNIFLGIIALILIISFCVVGIRIICRLGAFSKNLQPDSKLYIRKFTMFVGAFSSLSLVLLIILGLYSFGSLPVQYIYWEIGYRVVEVGLLFNVLMIYTSIRELWQMKSESSPSFAMKNQSSEARLKNTNTDFESP